MQKSYVGSRVTSVGPAHELGWAAGDDRRRGAPGDLCRATLNGFQDQARRSPTMQLPGRDLDPQPQRSLQLLVGLLPIETVRTNDILSVDEVLAQGVPMPLQPIERHARDTTAPDSQPRDKLGIRPTTSDAISAPPRGRAKRGNSDTGPTERVVLESPQMDRKIVRSPSVAQGRSVIADLAERITAQPELTITKNCRHSPPPKASPVHVGD